MNAERIFNEGVAQRLEAVYRTPEMVEQRRITIEALAPHSGERLLDIGTGPGLLALELVPHLAPDGHVTGIDVSRDMLAVAEQHRRQSAHSELLEVVRERRVGVR